MRRSFPRAFPPFAALVLMAGFATGVVAQQPAGGQPTPQPPGQPKFAPLTPQGLEPRPNLTPPFPERAKWPWWAFGIIPGAVAVWLLGEKNHKGAPPIWAGEEESPGDRHPAVALLGCLVYFSIVGGILATIFLL